MDLSEMLNQLRLQDCDPVTSSKGIRDPVPLPSEVRCHSSETEVNSAVPNGSTDDTGNPDRLSKEYIYFTVYWMEFLVGEHSYYLEAISSFLSNCLQVEPILNDIRRKPVKNFYEEDIYEVECVIEKSDRYEPDSHFAEIGRKWCDESSKPNFKYKLQWLAPHPLKGFWQGLSAQDKNIRIASVSLGNLIGLTTFVEHFKIDMEPVNIQRLSLYTLDCAFHHDEKVLHVYIKLTHYPRCEKKTTFHKFLLRYRDVVRVLISDSQKQKPTDLFFHCTSPAVLYQNCPLKSNNIKEDPLKTKIIDGQNLSWELALEFGCSCNNTLKSIMSIGGCLVLKLSIQDKTRARRILGRLHNRCGTTTEFYYCSINHFNSLCSSGKGPLFMIKEPFGRFNETLSFNTAYAFLSVLLQSFDVPLQMLLLKEGLEDMLEWLKTLVKEDSAAFESALFYIKSSLEIGNIVLFNKAISCLYKRFRNIVKEAPSGSSFVRRVFVTPARTVLLPPEVHQENRVLRQFNPDYLIRVSFRDNNLEKLSHTVQFHSNKDYFLHCVVGKTLLEGFKIGPRQYELVAWSCSQLRDHSIWMYSADKEGVTANQIRNWMGEFHNIKNVAKRMARMGQCFSSTEKTVRVPLESKVVQVEEDIIRGWHPESGNPYTFSDGIGMISPSLLEKVCHELRTEEIPSAIQIRYAGFKGMLCVNTSLEGDKLILRESMKKFTCRSSDYLEVIKLSAPRPVFLNRPLITILEQLGVSTSVFLEIQENMIVDFTDALVNEAKAVEILTSHVELPFLFTELSNAGFSLIQDPFYRSLLLAVYQNFLASLRTKSRIAVPVNKGRNMLGVLDETGSLNYGEVFVQYTELGSSFSKKSPKRKCLTGTVLITKCPCLHPGDVRKFKAVYVEKLLGITDCVVFPSKGHRPHPNEMSGSDLDGDEFIVIWDQRLFFPGENRRPMNFPDIAKIDSENITVEHMVRFFCDYIKNDSIGILSNAHLAWADQLEDGIFSTRCMSLARKASLCLDFAKTGVTTFMKREEKPPKYPDFMEKGGHKNTYRSSKALGALYRACRFLESVVNHMAFCSDSPLCPSLEVSGWENYKESALKSLHMYSTRLEKILDQHGIESEAEVMSGAINSFSKYSKETTDKLSLGNLIHKQSLYLIEKTRSEFFEELKQEYERLDITCERQKHLLKLQKASAFYMVAYSKNHKKFVSFPWCLSEVLLEILRFSSLSSDVKVPKNLLEEKINNAAEKDDDLGKKDSKDCALSIISSWVEKEGLSEKQGLSDPVICKVCLKNIFLGFINNVSIGDLNMSSEEEASSDCHKLPLCTLESTAEASVGFLVLNFLRHIALAGRLLNTRCDERICIGNYNSSEVTHQLSMAALRTYGILAITIDLCHIGLPSQASGTEPFQEVMEGNLVRISVTNDKFRDKMTYDFESVINLLKKWSGVKEVSIRGDKDFEGHWFLLVTVTGRDWQRWFLEELILQPWFEKAVNDEELTKYLK